MNLSLSDEEQTILKDVLTAFLSDLRSEVYKTENFEWRQDLKHREDVIKAILDQLTVA